METIIYDLKPMGRISGSWSGSRVAPSPPPGPTTASPTPRPCERCSAECLRPTSAGLCHGCALRVQAEAQAQAEADEILATLDVRADAMLRAAGLAPRECRADWAEVPRAISQALPLSRLSPLGVGQRVVNGFGLGSDTGAGKTCAIAAALRILTQRRLRWWAQTLVDSARAGAELGCLAMPALGLVWLNWPGFVEEIRANAISENTEMALDCAERAQILVIDDLGRERTKGAYIVDWAASQADRIVSSRYRSDRPIVWTTNLQEKHLVERYGAAMCSRLRELSPMTWLPGLPSLRVRPQVAP